MIEEQVLKIKKETGAIFVYVDKRYATPRFIPLYNEGQISFIEKLKNSNSSFFEDILIKIFKSGESNPEELEKMYWNTVDIND